MIYESVQIETPIKQGDIFRGIPRVDFSLSEVAIIDDDNTPRQVTWKDLLSENGNSAVVSAVLPMKSVDAIVITQNCDAVRSEYLCLCQIDDFLETIGKKESPPSNSNKWQSLIISHSRTNLRYFYLPVDNQYGFNEKKAVDFRVILRIPRIDIETLKELRVCRLNTIATEHFRETMAQFFRRYPYDEWYPLTKEEYEAYTRAKDEYIKPFPWQK
jgi:hypothetical protein